MGKENVCVVEELSGILGSGKNQSITKCIIEGLYPYIEMIERAENDGSSEEKIKDMKEALNKMIIMFLEAYESKRS